MMKRLIKNIHRIEGMLDKDTLFLRGKEMSSMQSMDNAWILIQDDNIKEIGLMDKPYIGEVSEELDARGSLVLPAFCDSHTHTIFAESREQEFEDRIHGLSYEDIAARGGGILNSVDKLRAMTEEELFQSTMNRVREIMAKGTGALEIKSGYGLDLDSELKMLRVADRVGKETALTVRSTFLGAHAFPREFKEDQEGYLSLILDEMIPKIAEEGLAEYIDAFCERGYFDKAQLERILLRGMDYGLKPKVHVNQFSSIGGLQMALKHNAVSVDHLEVMTDHDLSDICNSDTIATGLPACSFFIDIPYTPARDIIDNGGILALATDFNPGSSPCPDMGFVMSLACIRMAMTPQEALAACTINGASAMGLSATHGSITEGKKANLIITKPMQTLAQFPYYFASDSIAGVILEGKSIIGS